MIMLKESNYSSNSIEYNNSNDVSKIVKVKSTDSKKRHNN